MFALISILANLRAYTLVLFYYFCGKTNVRMTDVRKIDAILHCSFIPRRPAHTRDASIKVETMILTVANPAKLNASLEWLVL